ncbi:hypothetical protein DFJ74DRAFT_712111 [Hyaloraphidium curvatum]|nr:hypothetical protein DFJ74DRAFT_712111 [Hyaloraphidium curvatum]
MPPLVPGQVSKNAKRRAARRERAAAGAGAAAQPGERDAAAPTGTSPPAESPMDPPKGNSWASVASAAAERERQEAEADAALATPATRPSGALGPAAGSHLSGPSDRRNANSNSLAARMGACSVSQADNWPGLAPRGRPKSAPGVPGWFAKDSKAPTTRAASVPLRSPARVRVLRIKGTSEPKPALPPPSPPRSETTSRAPSPTPSDSSTSSATLTVSSLPPTSTPTPQTRTPAPTPAEPDPDRAITALFSQYRSPLSAAAAMGFVQVRQGKHRVLKRRTAAGGMQTITVAVSPSDCRNDGNSFRDLRRAAREGGLVGMPVEGSEA